MLIELEDRGQSSNGFILKVLLILVLEVFIYKQKFQSIRSLPPLAKKFVLQMLYIEAPVAAKSMEEWVLSDGVSKYKVALDRLIQLRVFIETADRYLLSFFIIFKI